MRKLHARSDTVLTPAQLAMLRRSIQRTAARFHQRLSRECIEDLMQEVLLRLWRVGAKDRLYDSPAYVRRVAENATIDTFRRRGAKKRRVPAAMFDPRNSSCPPHTPEEILMAREEAQRVLATNPDLRQRVRTEMEQHFPQQLRMETNR